MSMHPNHRSPAFAPGFGFAPLCTYSFPEERKLQGDSKESEPRLNN